MSSNKTTQLATGTIRTRSRSPRLLERSLSLPASYQEVNMWSVLAPQEPQVSSVDKEILDSILKRQNGVCGWGQGVTALSLWAVLPAAHHKTSLQPCTASPSLAWNGSLWSCVARNWSPPADLQSPLFTRRSPLENKPTLGLPKLSIRGDRGAVRIKFSPLWGRLVWAGQQLINKSGQTMLMMGRRCGKDQQNKTIFIGKEEWHRPNPQKAQLKFS